MKRIFSLVICICMCIAVSGCAAYGKSDIIDLTSLSSTMVYSEVSNMVTNPTDYLGKTVKIRGTFTSSYFEDTGKDYFYILVSDALSCCQNGIEFIWRGEHSYPDEYPEIGTQIEATGLFDTYDELGITYYYILIDGFKIV